MEELNETTIQIIAFAVIYLLLLFVFIFKSISRFGKVNIEELMLALVALIPITTVLTYAYKICFLLILGSTVIGGFLYGVVKLFIFISKTILSNKKFSLIFKRKEEN